MPIDTHRTYLQKHRFLERQLHESPVGDLGMVVVIPSYCESRLVDTLASLAACSLPETGVEVLVVFNSGAQEGQEVRDLNRVSEQAVHRWIEQNSPFFSCFTITCLELPPKHAGVGLARKIGMDEAVDRFSQVENSEGLILCLDADTTVAPSYFQAVERFFRLHPKMDACSIDIAHPLEGDDFPAEVYQGILRYELYLRYYLEGLRWAGHPYAYHTIGSAMAVRSRAYQRQGGMNRRKAGEDFYFLQKFIQLGTLEECHETCVCPSPRPATNVPFGTGKAVKAWLEHKPQQLDYPVFHPDTFRELRLFLEELPGWYQEEPKVSEPMAKFLREQAFFDRHLPEIRTHVASASSFRQRFFKWFDALKVLQYAHAMEEWFPKVALEDAVAAWPPLTAEEYPNDLKAWLEVYRTWQKRTWRLK